MTENAGDKAVSASDELLSFWFDEIGPAGWFNGGEAVDAACRARFAGMWEQARAGALTGWSAAPRSGLALVILLDQFPRNMFRGEARAFATDGQARAIAKAMIANGRQAALDPDGRQFVRLPLIHAETIADQEQGVRNCLLLGASADYLLHARAHREVIRGFGRFPFRNAALGRQSTPAETAWLGKGGYAEALRAVA